MSVLGVGGMGAITVTQEGAMLALAATDPVAQKTAIFSHCSGGWKSKVSVPATWLPRRPLFMARRWPPSCSLFTWPSHCASTPGVSLCV